jgi:CheY-like chemotaxis protein
VEGLPLTKILVADDEPAVRRLVRSILAEARAGWKVFEAADGREALRLALLERPAVALVDLRMPALDGIEVCRAIKTDPVARTTRVLIFTGTDDLDALRRAMDAGADGFLRKPLSAQHLLATLQALRDE